MDKNFIKGKLYKQIYRNEMNGYMVGLFKINDSNINYYQRILNDREDYKISSGELEGLNVVFNDKTNVNKI